MHRDFVELHGERCTRPAALKPTAVICSSARHSVVAKKFPAASENSPRNQATIHHYDDADSHACVRCPRNLFAASPSLT